MAIGCEPGQARKGAAVATDSGAVIRFTVAAFFSRLACKPELKAVFFATCLQVRAEGAAFYS